MPTDDAAFLRTVKVPTPQLISIPASKKDPYQDGADIWVEFEIQRQKALKSSLAVSSGRELVMTSMCREALELLCAKYGVSEVGLSLCQRPLQLIPGVQDRAIRSIMQANQERDPVELLSEAQQVLSALRLLVKAASALGVDMTKLVQEDITALISELGSAQ